MQGNHGKDGLHRPSLIDTMILSIKKNPPGKWDGSEDDAALGANSHHLSWIPGTHVV